MRAHRAFTLMELVRAQGLVWGLLCLALWVAPHVRCSRHHPAARLDAAGTQIASFKTALELYRADNGRLPTTAQGLHALAVLSTIPPAPRRWTGPYSPTVPRTRGITTSSTSLPVRMAHRC